MCPHCGGRMTPCPDGKPGRLVLHSGLVCSACGFRPRGAHPPKAKPKIWTGPRKYYVCPGKGDHR